MNPQLQGKARLIELANDPVMVRQAWIVAREIGGGEAALVTVLLWESGFIGIPYYTFPRYLAEHLKRTGWKVYVPGQEVLVDGVLCEPCQEPQAGDLFITEGGRLCLGEIGVVAKRGIARGEGAWFKAVDGHCADYDFTAYRRPVAGDAAAGVEPVAYLLRFSGG